MAGVDINWNLLARPSMADSYLKGVNNRNALMQQQQQAQRQARQDQMAEEEFGFRKQQYADQQVSQKNDRVAKALPKAYALVKGLQAPEEFEALKQNPMFRQQWDAVAAEMGVPGDLDAQTFDAVRQLQQIGAQLQPEEEYTLTPGAQRYRGGRMIAEAPRERKGSWRERANADGSTDLVWLYDEPPGSAPASQPQASGAAPDIKGGVEMLTGMGARVTSNRRSPGRNAAVGGVPNSFHLTGEAYDLVPPQGMTMAQLAAQARQAIPGADVIDEGDHVHIEPGGRRGGAQPYQVASNGPTPPPPSGSMRWDAPKPKETAASEGVRRLSAQEIAKEGLDPGGVYQIDNKGRITTVDKVTAEETKAAGYARRAFNGLESINRLAERRIYKPSAQVLISERNGIARFVARNPKDAQLVQAMNEWVIPLLRKDTGAAVTRSELQYYVDTYLPQPSDDPQTLYAKARARAELTQGLMTEAGRAYSSRDGAPKIRSLTDPRGAPQKATGSSSAPPAAVEHLKKNPNLAAAFDAKYGKGAAKAILSR